MTQTISAEQLTLYDLMSKFGLKRVDNSQFFLEWREELPELTEQEKQQLDRVKANYLNLSIRPLLEDMVKMVVLSPLLDLAGFYSDPFYSIGEESIKIELQDEAEMIKGKLMY